MGTVIDCSISIQTSMKIEVTFAILSPVLSFWIEHSDPVFDENYEIAEDYIQLDSTIYDETDEEISPSDFQSGFASDFQENNNTFLEEKMNSRKFGKVKSMLEYLYCENNENCDVSRLVIQKMLKYYGCNCFPRNKKNDNQIIPAVNAKPIDDIDEVCTNLAKRFSCFQHDIKNQYFSSETPCNTQVGYTWHVKTDFLGHETIACGPKRAENYVFYDITGKIRKEKTDKLQCKNALCQMEKEFSENIYTLVDHPVRFIEKFANNYKIESSERCPNRVIPVNDKKECCGAYPGRKSYNSEFKECCYGELTDKGQCDEREENDYSEEYHDYY